MKTAKTLTLLAMLSMATLARAQTNVYSLDALGYVNIPLVEGFNLIANQLDVDGTGTNNTISNMFGTNLPIRTHVYCFDPAASSFHSAVFAQLHGVGAPTWCSDCPYSIGQGFWVEIPAGAFGGAGITQRVMVAGVLMQGQLTNTNVPAGGGWSMVSSQIPMAGGLQTKLGYTPQVGEQFFGWDPVSNSFSYAVYAKVRGTTGWFPSEPVLKVGQGFWYNFMPGSSWSTNYSVVQ